MPLDRITAKVIESTKFRRPVYDRRRKMETDELVHCTPTYINQALRTQVDDRQSRGVGGPREASQGQDP